RQLHEAVVDSVRSSPGARTRAPGSAGHLLIFMSTPAPPRPICTPWVVDNSSTVTPFGLIVALGVVSFASTTATAVNPSAATTNPVIPFILSPFFRLVCVFRTVRVFDDALCKGGAVKRRAFSGGRMPIV